MGRKAFLASFFGLIGLLHLYIGLRLLPASAWPAPVTGGLWAALPCSFLLIVGGLIARILQQGRLTQLLSWCGACLLGLFSMLLVLTLLRDLAWLLLSAVHPAPSGFARDSARMASLLALLLTLIGAFNARRRASIKHVSIPIDNLPTGLVGLTIVQLSDIHIGPTIRKGYLQRIVTAVNAQKPDIIAITGDVVDGSVRQLHEHTAPLAQLRARYGSYLVTGNHEYYSGAVEWIAEFRRLGLTVLENNHQLIHHQACTLLLAGVTDYTAGHFAGGLASDPVAAHANAPADTALSILLAHQPRSAEAAAQAGFDLQLSGHTHGGQFVPWNWLVPLQQPFVAGLHRLGKLQIYVSRGTGYWGPPLRLFAPSEITLIRLKRA